MCAVFVRIAARDYIMPLLDFLQLLVKSFQQRRSTSALFDPDELIAWPANFVVMRTPSVLLEGGRLESHTVFDVYSVTAPQLTDFDTIRACAAGAFLAAVNRVDALTPWL